MSTPQSEKIMRENVLVGYTTPLGTPNPLIPLGIFTYTTWGSDLVEILLKVKPIQPKVVT